MLRINFYRLFFTCLFSHVTFNGNLINCMRQILTSLYAVNAIPVQLLIHLSSKSNASFVSQTLFHDSRQSHQFNELSPNLLWVFSITTIHQHSRLHLTLHVDFLLDQNHSNHALLWPRFLCKDNII